MDETLSDLGGYIESGMSDAVEEWHVLHGELTVTVARERVVEVLARRP